MCGSFAWYTVHSGCSDCNLRCQGKGTWFCVFHRCEEHPRHRLGNHWATLEQILQGQIWIFGTKGTFDFNDDDDDGMIGMNLWLSPLWWAEEWGNGDSRLWRFVLKGNHVSYQPGWVVVWYYVVCSRYCHFLCKPRLIPLFLPQRLFLCFCKNVTLPITEKVPSSKGRFWILL